MSDPLPDFLAAMDAAGVRPVEPIAQRIVRGGLIRFRCEGDKPGKQNGWAVLFLDGRPAGRFGNYRLGVDERWKGERGQPLDPARRRELQAEWREAAAKREREKLARWDAAAKRGARMWGDASAPRPDHPYLVAKGMTGEGLRQCGRTLLVPMRDAQGQLHNLQLIFPDGVKRFLRGGRICGLMFVVGVPGSTLCVGEGVSTMAAVRHATGHATAASFSADNLHAVAVALRERWPAVDMVICADNDAHLIEHPKIKKNLGLHHARAAAAAVGGRLAVPELER